MKAQLPTVSSAPPVSAWPLVQPRASLAPTPISAPPTNAQTKRPPIEIARTLLDRPAHAAGEEPGEEAADQHAEDLEDQPVLERMADAVAR